MSALDHAIREVADTLGSAAGTYYLGDGEGHLLPTVARDGGFAEFLRRSRYVYIHDDNGNISHALLDERVGLTYKDDADLADAKLKVELSRRGGVLWVTALSRQSIMALNGATPAEQQAQAATFIGAKQLDILRIRPTSPASTAVEIPDSTLVVHPATGVPISFDQPALNLAADIAALTSGQHQIAIPYCDPDTGELKRVLSAAVSAGGNLPARGEFGIGNILTLLQTAPIYARPSFAVYLYYGQAVVAEADVYRNYDTRLLVQTAAPGVATLSTSDATPTTLLSITVAASSAITLTAQIVAVKSDYSAALGGSVVATARRGTGNVVLVGSTITTSEDSSATPAITVDVDTATQTLRVRWAGVASEAWTVRIKYDVTKL